MSRLVLLCLSLFFAVIAHSNTIEGSWQSDREKTLLWNSENTNVDADYLEKLSTILGSHHQIYEDGKLCQFLFPQEYSYKGKPVPIYGLVMERSLYEVVEQNENDVTIRYIFEDAEESLALIIFETKDSSYGVPLNSTDSRPPGYREYYKRVELPRPASWGTEACYEL